MFRALLATTLRILVFRAGPQDMPYHPRLAQAVAPLAVISNALLLVQLAPMWLALLVSVSAVLGVVFATELILRARDRLNRSQQTLTALLATATVLNLLMLLPVMQVAPHLRSVLDSPKLMSTPQALALPVGPSLAIDAINLWNLVVSAQIFRHAADVRPFGGFGLALLCAATVLLLVFFVASVAGAILGG